MARIVEEGDPGRIGSKGGIGAWWAGLEKRRQIWEAWRCLPRPLQFRYWGACVFRNDRISGVEQPRIIGYVSYQTRLIHLLVTEISLH